VDRFDLICKLAAVEAVEGRGATAGEREAARQARLRLEERLASDPQLPTAFAEEMAHGAHLQPAPSTQPPAGRRRTLPASEELAARLQTVQGCPQSSVVLSRWAARLVDGVVFPQLPPDDPASVVPEVLLVLAAGPPSTPMVDSMIRFLQALPEASCEAWRHWFNDLETVLGGGRESQ